MSIKSLLTILSSLMISASGVGLVVACTKTDSTQAPSTNQNKDKDKKDGNGKSEEKPKVISKSQWSDAFRDSITGWDIENYDFSKPNNNQNLPKFPKQNIEVGTYSKKQVLDNSALHSSIKKKIDEILKIEEKSLKVENVYFDDESGKAIVKSTKFSDTLKVTFLVKENLELGAYTKDQILDNSKFHSTIKKKIAEILKVDESTLTVLDVYYEDKTGGGVVKSTKLPNEIKFIFSVKEK
ncbi:lipoprotein, (VlcD) [Mycoplasma mycoides subsp. mycoides]|uniref:Variable prolipoprotein n=2 Tax=Mycoplasma mycoides subsp. mycoides TaxID=2103 RepID=Q6MUB5_MYCMS|nr:hypothetical protein [Mycoplasma mycoides]PTD32695.1 putative lipoprotein [Mycoplasma mycoides subsp. mycoides C425/93]PTD33150.1 putative lipoprotein [Mycoplasma mycoides subsp. mycoides KH3J]CAE76769.1 putative variable prolipoprotein [Mycoplasma mycoides subsp. mycoides SC str. PG1]ADK70012.1 putative lipoprotein [Mycoplasma mycoides subsp. mycoides SC str. Gladysdale]KJQ45833.1 putative variable prolipoprotein [Mycoplasma mycoides subsp. mycoides]